MSQISSITDAVLAELNAATLSMSFDAVRRYLPVYELPDMQVLRVTVVPASLELQPYARGSTRNDVRVDVAVQKKLAKVSDKITDSDLNGEIDALVALSEEIADLFRTTPLASYPAAVWVGTENVPVFSMEHLERFRQFTSVIRFTFREER